VKLQEFIWNWQAGGDLHFDLATQNRIIILSLDFPVNYIDGSNSFHDQIGIPGYTVVQMEAGISVNQQFQIKIKGPLWSTQDEVMKQPFRAGIVFSPGSLSKKQK
jgi:hypothetical protein